jgi:hypothetical protein
LHHLNWEKQVLNMKMSREQLKAIVKECLLEILSDGLGNVATKRPTSTISGTVTESTHRSRRPGFDPRLDSPIVNRPNAMQQAIKQNAGGNKIMESIFADTAMTTLASQTAHGDAPTTSNSGMRIAQQEQFIGDPEQVFGEDVASRWANLAFIESPSKKLA